MIKMTKEEVKTVDKLKRRVHKQYPGAFLKEIKKGKYTIVQESANLNIVDLLAESFITPASNPIQAWENAALTVRINQNINRTHPLKLEALEAAGVKLKNPLNTRK